MTATDNSHRGEILVVDDTPANLTLLTQLLLSQHYKARPVASGQAAVAAATAQLPELILLDVRLPDISGFSVCRQLKADAHTRQVPILFISAFDAPAEQLEGFAAGGVDFITKPFEEQVVLARVATHLALARAQCQLEADRQQLADQNEQLAATQATLQRYIGIVNQYVSICRIDTDGCIIDISDAFSQGSGYALAELLGRPFQQCIGHPRLPPERLSDLWRTLQRGISWHGELLNRTKAGTDYWVQASIEPDCDASGEIHGFTLIQTDITDKKRVEQLSQRDPLTGLWNRRMLDEQLTEEWQRARRHQRPCCLIMIDIDHFKAINDNYGHLVGDRVLTELAALFQANIRVVDNVGRWGGEEFLILCPETTLEQGAQLAEKLRALTAQHTFPEVAQLTASFGVAELAPRETTQDLLQRADEALLQAKRQGRNCVKLAH